MDVGLSRALRIRGRSTGSIILRQLANRSYFSGSFYQCGDGSSGSIGGGGIGDDYGFGAASSVVVIVIRSIADNIAAVDLAVELDVRSYSLLSAEIYNLKL